MRAIIILITSLLWSPMLFACDCYGPQTFCGVQAPPPPFWEYAPPDHIIFAVKLGEVDYGMDVLVLQSLIGGITSDTVRVWGDCGLLCRVFVNTWADGDTLVLGLQDVDFTGNALCGTSFEQAGHYQISICGQQWLAYANGLVTGPILTEGATETMTLEQFITVLGPCLSVSVSEPSSENDLTILYTGNVPVLAWPTLRSQTRLRVHDASGRLVVARTWAGDELRLEGLVAGAYVVHVTDAGQGIRRKLVVPW